MNIVSRITSSIYQDILFTQFTCRVSHLIEVSSRALGEIKSTSFKTVRILYDHASEVHSFIDTTVNLLYISFGTGIKIVWLRYYRDCACGEFKRACNALYQLVKNRRECILS